MNKKGFTLIELIVVIVIIGILAAIAIPRFMGAQDRARIGAAQADVDAVRKALGLYEIDYSSYVLTADAADYATLVAALVMPAALGGGPYMSLPDGSNWDGKNFFSYAGDKDTYTLVVKAKNNGTTAITGTPSGSSIPVP